MPLDKLIRQSYMCTNLTELIRISRPDSAVERFALRKAKKELNKLHTMRKIVSK